MTCAQRNGSTWKVWNKDVELGVKMHQILSRTNNECLLLYNMFTTVWRHAETQLRRGHDLSTQIVLRNLQNGIIVIGVIDAFVSAHDHSVEMWKTQWSFGNCREERIRFMTAITPTYARAYQSFCLTRCPLVARPPKFLLPATEARYPHHPN